MCGMSERLGVGYETMRHTKKGGRLASPWELAQEVELLTIERKVFSRIRALICGDGQL